MTDAICFTCTFCQKKLSAKHAHVGRVTNCPNCKRSITVPQPTPAQLSAMTIDDGHTARTPENANSTRRRGLALSVSRAKGNAAIHQKKTSADPNLQNPVSVLLNSLVIDCLTERQKKVPLNALSESEFHDFARVILFQLQGAISQLESSGFRSPSEQNTGTQSVASQKELGHPSTKSSQAIGTESRTTPSAPEDRRRFSAEMPARDFAAASPPTLPPVVAPPPPVSPPASGIGAMAKIAGAALLGGAFGYLMGSRPNHGVGHGTHFGQGFSPMDPVLADESYPRASHVSYGSETDDPSSDRNTDRSRMIGFDTSGDGVPDHFVVDTDGDGDADVISHDANSDGLIDSFEMDNDNDGRFDQRFVAAPFSSNLDNDFAARPLDGSDSPDLEEGDQFADGDTDHVAEDTPLLEEVVATDEGYASYEGDDAAFDSEADIDAGDDVSGFGESPSDWG